MIILLKNIKIKYKVYIKNTILNINIIFQDYCHYLFLHFHASTNPENIDLHGLLTDLVTAN